MEFQDAGASWKFGSDKLAVEINKETLALTARHGDETWRTEQSAAEIQFGAPDELQDFTLASAEGCKASGYTHADQNGMMIELVGFPVDGGKDLRVRLFIGLRAGTSELHFRVVADEPGAKIKRLSWPGAFVAVKALAADATVVPYMQGMLLPGDWAGEIELSNPECNGRGLYMPWWGQCRGRAGYIAIIETDINAGVNFSHPAGGPTRTGIRWDASLGEFAYPRKFFYEFFEDCDYVSLARRYRAYSIETGHFVSLAEKIARSPKVGRMIGSPVIHTSILYHCMETSVRYSEDDPSANHRITSFAQRARQLRELHSRGVKKAYVHLDGWGVRGYDNLHPDYVPANEEAGGWAGMREIADACAEIDYIFALHDQYRDYFLDAPSFDKRHALFNEDGGMDVHSDWLGGPQTYLCGSLAPYYVKRNWEEIRRQGVNVDSAYLDVFSCCVPDQCFNPEHPMTRAECAQAWNQCFDYIRSLGGVVSSEETTNYSMGHLDLVHHAPYPTQPLYEPVEKKSAGVCVPLWSLVYHDAVLVPWHLATAGTSRKETSSFWFPTSGTPAANAHAALNAGLPYLMIDAEDDELALVGKLCELHEKVGLLEMTNHEMLDDEFRRQRTTFADGTTVEVDMADGTFIIR